MIKHFLSLERKQYFRSSYWQKNIALNILLVFFALYMIGIFVFFGVFMYKILTKLFPEQDPFIVANTFIFYWIIAELFIRFFFQKLPVMSAKPLLTLPVKRSSIVNFILGKSALSFFNFLPLFLTVPFSVSLLNNGYSASVVLTWLATMVLITFIANFLNFILEAFSAELDIPFLPLLIVGGGLFALNYFGIISFSEIVSQGILAITENPVYILVLIALLIGLYFYNFKLLKDKLYLDASLQSKVKEVNASDLSWTNRFGDIAPFMQLDLKLIWRNKRTKSMAFLMVIGLLYGLFFYPQPIYRDMTFMFAFIGIFSTGFFLINFGQFIPAWDSGYYKMLMSQNIKYEQYLRSKWILMTMSVVVMFVLGIPYVYFGYKILIAHAAAAVYNIGVNTHVIMWGGSFNRKKIDLDKKAAFNYQGTGAVQWLIGIPLMLVPMAIFGLLDWLIGFEVAVAVLVLAGGLGILLHKPLMKGITQKYLDSKYKMIAAFGKDS
ncbi:hypothetical protein DFQ05_1559 [Winogradskyella wandonensis]|uniref:ABC-2 type transport system permease protein n=1 Tax=Winogradskyella wandonensis TaxID=1442586 RepID=A0A4R1KRY0_9FLAO|nr:DUF5687 family protein [Winogradskyella wandonensis]TCK67778.1 hypothetical protein DFQ05_1559 [Winogradskyella wandonensis]